MSKEIKLIKNNDKLDLSDVEWVDRFDDFLITDLKMPKSKAFRIIYFLQEHLPVFPDHIERCHTCGQLYDSYSSGHYSEMMGRYYCSESCEPPRLYDRELRWEKRADAPFQKWMKQVKREQKHYPVLKGKQINESFMRAAFQDKQSPIQALNDILTRL